MAVEESNMRCLWSLITESERCQPCTFPIRMWCRMNKSQLHLTPLVAIIFHMFFGHWQSSANQPGRIGVRQRLQIWLHGKGNICSWSQVCDSGLIFCFDQSMPMKVSCATVHSSVIPQQIVARFLYSRSELQTGWADICLQRSRRLTL